MLRNSIRMSLAKKRGELILQTKTAVLKYLNELPTINAATVSHLNKLQQAFHDVDNFTRDRVTEYIANRRLSGAKPSTVNREITIMRQFCAWMVKLGMIKVNHAEDMKYGRLNAPRVRWLTADEEHKLLACCPAWVIPIVKFALATGMRRGEILALEWDSINLDSKTAIVRSSKNGEPRIIPLTEDAEEAVLQASASTSSRTFVFTYHDAEVNKVTLDHAFRKAIKQAGLHNVHFHDLRHTFATRLVQRGADIFAVQRLLGHKNPSMTHRYSHHSIDSLRRALECLSKK